MAETKPTGWVGWVYFAGIMMVIAGILQGIVGLTALLNDTFFVIGEGGLAVLDITTWGWLHLLIGVVLFAAGVAVVNGSVWGRAIGVILAVLSFVANLVFVSAYPLWAIIAMVIDVLVIYALVVHGGEAKLES